MPNPMSLDPDHQPAGTVASPESESDSSGRPLALRLPDWDLVPPTEFVQRHPDR